MSEGNRQLRRGEAAMTVEEVFDIAPLERAARIFTTIITAFSLGLSGFLVVVAVVAAATALIAVPCLLLGILVVSLAMSPTGFAVGSGQLAVTRRALRPLLFPLVGLAAARPTALPRSWRLLGNGGVFGFWGTFRNKDWGRFKVYATDQHNGVLLEWPGRKMYVTPADREGFCRAVLARSAQAGGQLGPPQGTP